MTLLRIDASILGPYSAGSELADLVLEAWSERRPHEPVVTRHLGTDPLPATAWAAAVSSFSVPEEQRTPAQREALALAHELITEVRSADALLLAFPLYNWGVSQNVKVWIDLLVAGGAATERVLEGKPVVLVSTRGGAYGPGMPREGWDHNTPYLRQVLAGFWGADLTVVERELTLAGTDPALDRLAAEAEAERLRARAEATAAGRALAG
ncbi:NAD(P)H-dependent oxidoreductase [Kineosporia sp. J2-2]|uniref:FMN dependent NADH:quinone oxidoreductase n=1 Tax=Kineosporia corallincola TaxID=2835133 RepID=A0ABS5TQC7_9ACTN|nr:NAD(P)H-dependent oxidoreductase [Kineosporia corallincola]MBT0773215.1 NAD(P)H-dependent oxidoreductase [Kineosporia corallincola]